MTRWFVQLEARFRSVWPLAVEEAVAERLDRAGRLLENGVHGDPGPILCAHLVIEGADAEAAAASGWGIYRQALDAAGAEDYAQERTVTVPMAEVESGQAEARTRMEALSGTPAAGAAPQDGLRLDDLRHAES